MVRELGLPFHDVDWDDRSTCWSVCTTPKHEVNIAIVGKYIRSAGRLPVCHQRPSRPAAFANWAKVNVKWVVRPIVTKLPKVRPAALDNVDGIVIPGGFGIPRHRRQDRRSGADSP